MPNGGSTTSPATLMPELPDFARAFIDAAADRVAGVIERVEREASRAEDLRAAEYRAFMAEQREKLAGMERRFEERLATVRDGRDGADGKDGRDGADADPVEIERRVAEAVARIPVPQDGRDGVDGVNGHDGRDGADVDPAEIERMVVEAVERIPLPADGKDADPEFIRSMVADEVGKAVASIPMPKDGEPGPPGRDGKDADDTAIRHAEELRSARFDTFLAEQRGTMIEIDRKVDEKLAAVRDGVDGKDGRDGIDGRDGANGKDAYPGEVKGLYDPASDYRARDIVALDGGSWIARQDDPGPLPGDGWMLMAARGQRGGRGETGERGSQGLPGHSPPALVGFYADPKSLQAVITMSDGEEHKADLYEFARAIRGEA